MWFQSYTMFRGIHETNVWLLKRFSLSASTVHTWHYLHRPQCLRQCFSRHCQNESLVHISASYSSQLAIRSTQGIGEAKIKMYETQEWPSKHDALKTILHNIIDTSYYIKCFENAFKMLTKENGLLTKLSKQILAQQETNRTRRNRHWLWTIFCKIYVVYFYGFPHKCLATILVRTLKK